MYFNADFFIIEFVMNYACNSEWSTFTGLLVWLGNECGLKKTNGGTILNDNDKQVASDSPPKKIHIKEHGVSTLEQRAHDRIGNENDRGTPAPGNNGSRFATDKSRAFADSYFNHRQRLLVAVAHKRPRFSTQFRCSSEAHCM